MDFLIVYERKYRELENAILLKIEIEKRGYTCSIVQFYEADKFKNYNAKVILTPNMYETKAIPRVFSRFGKSDFWVNLQYEQVLSINECKEDKLHNISGEAKKGIHICWGTITKDRLVNEGTNPINLPVLGAIQLDLLREEYRLNSSDIKSEMSETCNIDSSKKWSLFISSFTFADIAQSRLEMNEKIVNEDLSYFVELHTNSRNEMIKWFDKILEEDRENIIIYRPHPDEIYLSPVLKLEKKHSNFKIIREGSVKIWIQACDNIFTWLSTSVVEAHFLNKNYYILRPSKIRKENELMIMIDSEMIESYEEFRNRYFFNYDKKYLPMDSETIEKYYKFDENKPSFIKYVDMLENLIKNTKKQRFDIKFTENLRANIITLAVKTMYFLYKNTKINLDKYRNNTENNFFINWFIEFDNQVATDEEKNIVQNNILKILNKKQ